MCNNYILHAGDVNGTYYKHSQYLINLHQFVQTFISTVCKDKTTGSKYTNDIKAINESDIKLKPSMMVTSN